MSRLVVGYGIEFLHFPNVLPPKPPGKGQDADGDRDSKVHDVVNSFAVGLKRSSQRGPRHELTNGPNPSADNDVWRDANGGNALLQLVAEAITEDGVCGD